MNKKKNQAPHTVSAPTKPITTAGKPASSAAGSVTNQGMIVQAQRRGSACDREKPSRRTNVTSLINKKTIVVKGLRINTRAIGGDIHH